MKRSDALDLILVMILICGLFEAALVGISYFFADRIECNLLWCSFITERGTGQTISTRDCFINGIRVNCSDFKNRNEDYWYHGWTSSSEQIYSECSKEGEIANDETKCPNGIPIWIKREGEVKKE